MGFSCEIYVKIFLPLHLLVYLESITQKKVKFQLWNLGNGKYQLQNKFPIAPFWHPDEVITNKAIQIEAQGNKYLRIIPLFPLGFVLNYSPPPPDHSILRHSSHTNLQVARVTCAFVSRYGDLVPRTFLSRVVSVLWMIVGYLTLAMFHANLTALITSKEIPMEVSLVGEKVWQTYRIFSSFPISIMLWGFGGVTRGQNCTYYDQGLIRKILQIPHLISKYKMKQLEVERDMKIFKKL